MDASMVDQIRLNFNPQGLLVINIAIGLMMFGVALDLKLEDFKRIVVSPRAPGIGLAAQFILLPAFTYLLTLVLRPLPSIALGMILVAACPGGNLSNIITYLAKGNTAVSISMTAVSTAAAIIMTPLNLSLWGSLNPHTAELLRRVSLSPVDVFTTIFLILGVPLVLGLSLSRIFPSLADKVRKPFKIFSLVFFILIVCGALAANWSIFLKVVGLVMLVVLLHNALALNLGYWSGRVCRLDERDSRAVCIEVGIQNSALGLVLVFNFFEGLGGMAILVAWWGIWHIIAGLITAFIFTRFPLPQDQQA
ncbi:MAG: bile acid:sodium symporter family protein [Deltaproteobacteria bacterium]|nr:bile acid:sodium symporter family protein [Deltaproteobacteria bacterium]MBW2048700.1 bile acid:sodium symporter family protein [Deltaproteobacteria bacterium]MBW2111088.1 bile acid:sodium symporter family protein [Deltaproteobacteria bacterium]MBW2353510.1 bile acid:sodium symporter family protein [Deltaproteobacteria bacterium]HDZ91199.1 bile acid:sodium symporter family protein [Deltaproteobacteria bacterium]